MTITPASNFLRRVVRRDALVRLDGDRWNDLLDELAERGQGWRESGAFLLAPKRGDRRTITAVAYFDDLDPDSLTGGIRLRSFAFSRLWRICREQGLAVAADVHTHPGDWVGQSGIDRENPMIARPGHYAIIVPALAAGSRDPSAIGFHVYDGDAGWSSHLGRAAAKRLYVGRWA